MWYFTSTTSLFIRKFENLFKAACIFSSINLFQILTEIILSHIRGSKTTTMNTDISNFLAQDWVEINNIVE